MHCSWIKNIPSNWERVPFGSLFTQRKSKNQKLERDFVLSVVKGRGVIPYSEKGNLGNKVSEDLSKYKLVETGDFVLNSMNLYMGSVGVSRYEGITSTAYIVCTPSDRVEAGYYEFVIRCRGFQEYVGLLGKGIMEIREAVRWTALKSVSVPFPELTTQKRIADFLDRETARIDQLIEKKQRLVELLGEKRSATITVAVTKGLDLDVPMTDSGIKWLGDVPEGWVISPLKRVASIRYGIGEPPSYQEEGTPLIRATNVNAGSINREGLVLVNPSDIPEKRIIWLLPGDIIVVRSGAYTGDSAIIRAEHCPCIAGFDMVVHPTACLADFLQYALLSSYVKKDQLDLKKTRAAQPHLNSEELGGCILVLPPLSEQSIIVDYLNREIARIDMVLAKTKESIEKLREFCSALITAAVTGQIDVETWSRRSNTDHRLDAIEEGMHP
ncbi:MAG: restriction endonuclease subunit S [Firmicutes bacterium]|nr:restriction endonuclease subunit S [Bacillota bacterium]MBV1727039.1 restriction endonuclease subunit S [Desulforudis sp.]MBV1734527.1 restriction endonuclease subunit S [Desulforudis sp.]